MFFAIREVLGWALILVAVVVLWIALQIVTNADRPQIIEGAAFVFAGTAVLKAGVLLVRISTAARICRLESASEPAGDDAASR